MDTLQLYETPLIHDIKGEGTKNSSNALNIDEKLLFELDPAQELSFDLSRYLNNSSPATNVLSPDTSVATKPSKAELTSPVHTDYVAMGVTSPPCYTTPAACMPEFEQLASGSDDSESVWEQVSTVKSEEDIGYYHNFEGSGTVGQVHSTTVSSSSPATSPMGSPGERESRKRSVPKGSEEYIEKRARNNVAVRKSRAKAKEKQKQTEGRVGSLQGENERLQKKVDLLTKELNVLKGLFINVGSALPSSFAKLLES